MRTFAVGIVAVSLVVGCARPARSVSNVTTANTTLADLTAGRFEAIHRRATTDAAPVLNTRDIAGAWGKEVTGLGSYQSVGSAETFRVSGADGFDYPLTFQHGEGHVQVVVRSGMIAGLVILAGPPTATFGK